ncbi:MAG: hypothetical protein M1834_001428 [Cirrosporium novae-zelandiae]|nr:MAG: hypothetical protein M1834_001428 [Cirrosporium novae-zelandiae]
MASSSSGSSFKQQSPAPSMSGSTTSTDMSSVTAAPPTIISSEKTPDDSSKLKTFLGILRKFIGVTDIATVRFSLPSQLIEPIPNLGRTAFYIRPMKLGASEPETFVSIGDSDDSVERMLEVLRFWFTKDLVRDFARA